VPTKTPCRIRRSSRRMGRIISRASISCGRCGASIRACRAACTCIPARASCCARFSMYRCSARRDMLEMKHDELQQRLEYVEALLDEAEQSADPAARKRLNDVIQALLDYYGAGLARILEVTEKHGSLRLFESIS